MGWLPALKPLNFPLPQRLMAHSAIRLRAELPVHRNRTCIHPMAMAQSPVEGSVHGCAFGAEQQPALETGLARSTDQTPAVWMRLDAARYRFRTLCSHRMCETSPTKYRSDRTPILCYRARSSTMRFLLHDRCPAASSRPAIVAGSSSDSTCSPR